MLSKKLREFVEQNKPNGLELAVGFGSHHRNWDEIARKGELVFIDYHDTGRRDTAELSREALVRRGVTMISVRAPEPVVALPCPSWVPMDQDGSLTVMFLSEAKAVAATFARALDKITKT